MFESIKQHKVAVALLPILLVLGILARLFIGIRDIGMFLFIFFCMDVVYLMFFTNVLSIRKQKK